MIIVEGGAAGLLAGMSTGGNTLGTTGLVGNQLILMGGNNITLSQSVNGQSASLTVVGAAGDSRGMSNLGATSGTTGLVSLQQVFVGTNGIGLSQSVNGGSATLSIQPSPYLSNYLFQGPTGVVYRTFGAGTVVFGSTMMPWPLTATAAVLMGSVSISSSSNSSHAATLSAWVGIYTRNASTMSLATSGSQSWAWTNTSNNSQASLSGQRLFTVPMNVNMTPAEYFMAVVTSSATAGANWATMSLAAAQVVNTPVAGHFGSASATSAQYMPGIGFYTAATAGLPASVAFSHLSATSGIFFPAFGMANYTA